MNNTEHKPLFNRRYLFWLMWAVAIAIVLLQTLTREDVLILQTGYSGERQAYWLEQPKQEQVHTHLLLLTGAVLNELDLHRQQLISEGVNQHLASPALLEQVSDWGWQISLTDAADHLQLEIISPELPQQAQLANLVQLLQQPVAIDSDALRQRIQAERYIQTQSPQPRLLQAATSQLATLSDVTYADDYASLMQQLPRLITFSGPSLQLDASAPPERNIDPLTPQPAQDRQPVPQLLQGYQSEYHHLHAWSLEKPDTADMLARQRLSADLLTQLLQRPLPGEPEYRLVWSPMSPAGYVAIFLSHQEARPLPTSKALREHLLQHLTDELLQQSSRALIQQTRQILDDPGGQRRWLDLLARYQLPADSHQLFLNTLENATLAQMQETLGSLLEPDEAIHITLEPY
ncbi:hypothetical protein [Nitrincola alkalilacustris]|uniref:hypothetical protein n=1 Tax=Nitrincola alkalilacustris TaxID=1571224 RepID=UPI00124C6C2D|nr:hypothetical protein [Nitrincola alkalilacustris]